MQIGKMKRSVGSGNGEGNHCERRVMGGIRETGAEIRASQAVMAMGGGGGHNL